MISVCLASFNGEKYIKEQIESILSELPNNAELIISDDGSADNTLEIIRGIKDNRIKLIQGPGKGVVKNFEYALSKANGDIIFLSDQDDIWMPGKVEKVLNVFDEKTTCVLHDAEVVDKDENILMPSFFKWRNVKHGLINNILKNSYTGCCMAIKRELLNDVFPFPEGIEMHDWWIGLNAEKNKSSVFIEDKLIKYRRHGNNTNSLEGYPLKRKIHNRLTFIKAVI